MKIGGTCEIRDVLCGHLEPGGNTESGMANKEDRKGQGMNMRTAAVCDCHRQNELDYLDKSDADGYMVLICSRERARQTCRPMRDFKLRESRPLETVGTDRAVLRSS